MDRRSLLEEKRQQLNHELRQWAEESNLLKPGEFLYLTIAIAQSDEAVVSVARENSSDAPQYDIEVQWKLEKADWKFLLETPWSDPQHKAVLELLKTRGNKPTSRDDIQQQLGFELTAGFRKSINAALRRCCEAAGRCTSRYTPDFAVVDVDQESKLPIGQRRIRLRKYARVLVKE